MHRLPAVRRGALKAEGVVVPRSAHLPTTEAVAIRPEKERRDVTVAIAAPCAPLAAGVRIDAVETIQVSPIVKTALIARVFGEIFDHLLGADATPLV